MTSACLRPGLESEPGVLRFDDGDDDYAPICIAFFKACAGMLSIMDARTAVGPLLAHECREWGPGSARILRSVFSRFGCLVVSHRGGLIPWKLLIMHLLCAYGGRTDDFYVCLCAYHVPLCTWLLLTVKVVVSISQSIHAATSPGLSSEIVGSTPSL